MVVNRYATVPDNLTRTIQLAELVLDNPCLASITPIRNQGSSVATVNADDDVRRPASRLWFSRMECPGSGISELFPGSLPRRLWRY